MTVVLLRLRSNSEQDNQRDDKAHGGLRVKETDRYYVPNLSDSLNWNERILVHKERSARDGLRGWHIGLELPNPRASYPFELPR